jgi:hypothetical protein
VPLRPKLARIPALGVVFSLGFLAECRVGDRGLDTRLNAVRARDAAHAFGASGCASGCALWMASMCMQAALIHCTTGNASAVPPKYEKPTTLLTRQPSASVGRSPWQNMPV